VAVIYLPDTNAWISYLRRNSPALVQRFARTNPSDIRLCSVVVGELIYGVFHGPSSYKDHNESLVLKLRQQFGHGSKTANLG
jgi:predicted nucleic acid-binding protein